jgi:hypothetical protein
MAALAIDRLRLHVSTAAEGDFTGFPYVGSLPTPENQQVWVINEAGRLLFMHPWSFRERPPLGLDFTADQAYVELPSDFGELLSCVHGETLTNGIQLTTLHQINQMRAYTTSVSGLGYWAAISQPFVDSSSGMGVTGHRPRLELYPTPSADETDALTITYRADWIDFDGSREYAPVPVRFEPLFAQYIRAVVRGYSRDARAETLMDEVARVEESSIFKSARKADTWQPDYGPLSGGHMNSGYASYWGDESVANPS